MKALHTLSPNDSHQRRLLPLPALVAGLLSLLAATGCQKESPAELVIAAESVTPQPTFLDGRLRFETASDVRAFMTARIGTELEDAPLDIAGHKSYYARAAAAFERLESDDITDETGFRQFLDNKVLYVDEKRAEVRSRIPDGPFTRILNEDGEYAVNDTVYQFSETTIKTSFRGADGSLTLLTTEPSSFEVLSETIDGDPDAVVQRDDVSCIMRQNSRRRGKGEFQKNNFVAYAEFRAVTKRQRRILGTWHRRKADFLRLEGCAQGYLCFFQEWSNFECNAAEDTDVSSVDAVLTQLPFGQYCGDNGSSRHFVRHDGWSRECGVIR